MKSWIVAAGLIVALTATTAAAETAGQLAAQVQAQLKGKRYTAFRPVLISQGFYPIKLPQRRDVWPCGDGSCVRNPELIDCGGGSMPRCWLVWAGPDHSGYFLLEVEGETKWSFGRMRPMSRAEYQKMERGIREAISDPDCKGCAPSWGSY